MKYVTYILTVVMLYAAGTAAHADNDKPGDLQIVHPWAKPSLKGVPNSAAYMAITNTGDSDDRLISATGDVSQAVELHTMSMTDGVMRMRRLKGGVPLPAGETVTLAPGGKHVMLIGLKGPLETGSSFDLTLTFENAGTHRINVEVSETPPEDGADSGS